MQQPAVTSPSLPRRIWDLPRVLAAALRSRFLKDLVSNVTSSAALFAITIVTTPMMTRLFPPEAYGVSGIMGRCAMLLSAVGLLGLPIALSRAHHRAEQDRLFLATLILGAIVSLLSIIGCFILRFFVAGIPASAVAVLPLLVLAHCINIAIRSQATANGQFHAMAKAKFADGLGARALSLAGGFLLHAGPVTMMLADIAGKIAAAVLVWKTDVESAPRTKLLLRREMSRLPATIHEFRSYATYANIAAILPILSSLIIDWVIARRYGIDDTGHYLLAMSILTMPVTLIALSSAPVVFHRMVKDEENGRGEVVQTATRSFFGFVAVGAACMMPILLFGPALFSFFFGETWRISGAWAQIMALPMILNFSYVALLGIFHANQKSAKTWFWAELISLVVLGIAVMLWQSDVKGFICLLAVIYMFRFVFMHFAFLVALRTTHEEL